LESLARRVIWTVLSILGSLSFGIELLTLRSPDETFMRAATVVAVHNSLFTSPG